MNYPRSLSTAEDYRNAPLGTVVAWPHEMPWTKDEPGWICNGTTLTDEELAATRQTYKARPVLRYDWDGRPLEKITRKRQYAVAVSPEPGTWKYLDATGGLAIGEDLARWVPIKAVALAFSVLWFKYPTRILRRFVSDSQIVEERAPRKS